MEYHWYDHTAKQLDSSTKAYLPTLDGLSVMIELFAAKRIIGPSYITGACFIVIHAGDKTGATSDDWENKISKLNNCYALFVSSKLWTNRNGKYENIKYITKPLDYISGYLTDIKIKRFKQALEMREIHPSSKLPWDIFDPPTPDNIQLTAVLCQIHEFYHDSNILYSIEHDLSEDYIALKKRETSDLKWWKCINKPNLLNELKKLGVDKNKVTTIMQVFAESDVKVDSVNAALSEIEQILSKNKEG